jgi:hypothetical protein
MIAPTPLRIEPKAIRDVPVEMTMVGGRVVYDATATPEAARRARALVRQPSSERQVECCVGQHA